MSDILCGYQGQRETTLMAYLYDELSSEERAEFDRHVTTCARCRVELNGLGEVRAQLARWVPPELSVAVTSRQSAVASQQSSVSVVSPPLAMSHHPSERQSWWREMPAWAQVAAAMLVLGVSAGIANLDVHYDASSGLNVHTGWSKPAVPASSPIGSAASNAATPRASKIAVSTSETNAPWRADLVALQEQLRTELRAATTGPTFRNAAVNDAEVVRRLKGLIDDSERRQQRELALRVADVLRDVNTRRDADLRRIDQNLGLMLDRTGVEVMKNRQMIDYYLQRVSQRQ